MWKPMKGALSMAVGTDEFALDDLTFGGGNCYTVRDIAMLVVANVVELHDVVRIGLAAVKTGLPRLEITNELPSFSVFERGPIRAPLNFEGVGGVKSFSFCL